MDLPAEILSLIFEFVNGQRQFAALVRVSRLFKDLAEPLLYRGVIFRSISSDWQTSRSTLCHRIQQFRERITSHPDRRFAKRVESYATMNLSYSSAILPELVNLHRFKANSLSPIDFTAFSTLSNRLTHFHCDCYITDPPAFKLFLESQASLVYLYFANMIAKPQGSLSSHALSRLRALSVELEGLFYILPGRDIHHLTIQDARYLPGALPGGGLKFPTVQTLHLQGGDKRLSWELLWFMPKFFPNVKFLELDDQQNESSPLHGNFVTPTKIVYLSLKACEGMFSEMIKGQQAVLIDKLLSCFADMPRLRVLDVAPCNPGPGHSQCGPFQSLRCIRGNPIPMKIWQRQDDLASWALWWQGRGLESLL